VYELTPEGIRRTAPAGSPEARPEYEHRSVGQKLNAIIVVVLVLAVALLGWRLYAVRHAKTSTLATATLTRSPDSAQRNPGNSARRNPANAAPNVANAAQLPDTAAKAAGSGRHTAQAIPAKSVAVLPFANESGDKDEQFFSDGLSDDLITALSQFAGLKVISRNSAFQFRDSRDTSAKIGKLLGVAHLLEGSVQHAGDEVRITATLVNASDGSILWSQRYDKPYKDLFALQDAITQAVAGALKAKLLTTNGAVVQSDRPPSGNLAAYAAYQHGKAYDALGTEAATRRAIDAYAEATRLDPHYAAAYAQLSMDQLELPITFGAADATRMIANAREASATALALNPDSALAHLARAYLSSNADMDWRGAAAEIRRALQLAPNDAPARNALARQLAALGQVGGQRT
jgi:TolB-like protein